MDLFDLKKVINESCNRANVKTIIENGNNHEILYSISKKYLRGKICHLLWELVPDDSIFIVKDDPPKNLGLLLGDKKCILFFDLSYPDYICKFNTGFDVEKFIDDLYAFDVYITDESLSFFIMIYERKFISVTGIPDENINFYRS